MRSSMNLTALRGDLSVLELSRRSGVARNTIAALERGEGNPTVDTLYALARRARRAALAPAGAGAAPRPCSVVRAGEGAHVEGAALDAHLLERIERPGLLGELYAIRFHRARRAGAAAPVRRRGAAAHLHRAACASGRSSEPVELGPGDYAATPAPVPHVYEALGGEARGTLLMLTPEEVAMKRAARMEGIAGFGIDRVAAAVLDPDVLRLENLDTDLPLPPEAVAVTRSALDDPVSNSWLPFTGDLGLRAAISDHIAARHGRVYDPEREIVVTCGGTEGVLDVLLATLDPGDEVVLTDPIYAGLVNRVRLAGGVPVFAPLARGRRRVAARSRRAARPR